MYKTTEGLDIHVHISLPCCLLNISCLAKNHVRHASAGEIQYKNAGAVHCQSNGYGQGLIEPSGKRACNCQYRNVDSEMLSVTINRYPYTYVYLTYTDVHNSLRT